MNDDQYGSILREKLKESMEVPFTPRNRMEPAHVPTWKQYALMVLLLAVCTLPWLLLNKIEGLFR